MTTPLPPAIVAAPTDPDGIPIPPDWLIGPRAKTWHTLSREKRMGFSESWISRELKAHERATKPRRVEREKSEGYDGSHFSTKALRVHLWANKAIYGTPIASESYNHKTGRRNDVRGAADVVTSFQRTLHGHQAGTPGEEAVHKAKALAAGAKELYAHMAWWEFVRGQAEPVRGPVWWW